MDYNTIEYVQKDTVGYLFLNRPEVLNSLSEEMGNELMHCISRAAGDEQLKVLVLAGRGKAFSAGGDLKMFKQRYESFREHGQKEATVDPELPRALADFPKPIIAAVHGAAVGFGATLPLTCDIRLASPDAYFSYAFARAGVTPEFGSSYFLPRIVGYGKAMELVLTARTFDATEALQMGLVNRVAGTEEVLSEAESMAREIAGLPAPAVKAAKKLLRHGSQSTLDQVLDYEALVFQHASQTEEHYEAVCSLMQSLSNK